MSYDIQGYYSLVENFISFGFGDKGSKGEKGDEGEIGKIGNRGQLGISGEKGDQGVVGVRGDIGPRGSKGLQGEVGPNGKNGLRGDRGKQGTRGDKGPVGPKGEKGPQGFMGPFGSRGDRGVKGDRGKQGEDGYKGLVNINYGKCSYTRWSDYFKNTEIKCPDNKIGVKMDTKCQCTSSGFRFGLIRRTSINNLENCKSKVPRDCSHRILCCPLQLNDIPESENVLDKRFFSGTVPASEKEKLINKIWITLKPTGLNKTIEDYPVSVFRSDASGNFRYEEEKYKQIPYTSDCKSKFCKQEGQLCVDNKVCLNKKNFETMCLKPPCWHNILEEKTNCDHKCEYEELGSLCGDKICDMRKNDKCDNPPCWNKIPLLEKCKGVRCPTKGQQCALGGDKYNLVGFECKDEKNLNSNNYLEHCQNPPCWHKAEQYTLSCDDPSCRIIGQKCGSKDEYTKICLNKKNVNCDNPPCWHDVSMSQCNDLLRSGAEDTTCAPESLKDFRGNEILDANGSPIFIIQNCDYAGDCSKIGSRCLIDNEVKFECMNSKRFLDIDYGSTNKKKCNNLPCWFPLDDKKEQVFDYYISINDKKYKSDSDILSLDVLKKNSRVDESYEFVAEDRQGTIDFNTFFKFLNDNWPTFEANCKLRNAQQLWNKYVGQNNRMDYYQFNGVMRILKVEKFKYRENLGRIFPQVMNNDDYNKIFNYYKIVYKT